MKDHSETTQIQFDPRVISFTELLEIFWARHDYATPIESQYKSAIFYNNSDQKTEALASAEAVRKGKLGQAKLNSKDILTVIEPATKLYVAELYHQKYYLQCNHQIFAMLHYKVSYCNVF